MLHDLISSKKNLFNGGVHTELRAQVNKSRKIILLAGNLITNTRTENSGVSARVYKNGVYGFSSMAEYNDYAVESVLKAATDNALFMNKHINKDKGMFEAIPYGNYKMDSMINETEQKIYIEYIKEIDNYIIKKYPNLKSRRVL
ncbi:MAG TPA: hypothetical protein DC000_08865 [Clostridiales bacterium]|nr:hypothetical protein [Clostridiales bacterium]